MGLVTEHGADAPLRQPVAQDTPARCTRHTGPLRKTPARYAIMPRIGLCSFSVSELGLGDWQIPTCPFKVFEGAVGAYHDKRSGHWYVKYSSNFSSNGTGRVQIKHGTFIDAHVAWATARWLTSQPCAMLLSTGNKADAFRESLRAVLPPAPKRHLDDPGKERAKCRCVDATTQTGIVTLIEDVD